MGRRVVGHHVGHGVGVRDGIFDDLRRGGFRIEAVARQLDRRVRIVDRIVVDDHGPVEIAAAGRGEVHGDVERAARRDGGFVDVRLEEGIAGADELDVADVQRDVAAVGDGDGHVRGQAHAHLAEVQGGRRDGDGRREQAEVVLVRGHHDVADVFRIVVGRDQGERVVAADERCARNGGRERPGPVQAAAVDVRADGQIVVQHGAAGPQHVAVAGGEEAAVEVLDVPGQRQPRFGHVRQQDVRPGRPVCGRDDAVDERRGDFRSLDIVVVHGEVHEVALRAVQFVEAQTAEGVAVERQPFRRVVDRIRVGHRRQALQGHVAVQVAAARVGAHRVHAGFVALPLHQEHGIIPVETGRR